MRVGFSAVFKPTNPRMPSAEAGNAAPNPLAIVCGVADGTLTVFAKAPSGKTGSGTIRVLGGAGVDTLTIVVR